MKLFRRSFKGFTLLEMMLVMVIIAIVIVGMATYSQQRMLQLRQDRTVLQVQQILNAGLAYYLNNSTWPTSMADLQGDGTAAHPGGYLPAGMTIVNPWGSSYFIGPNALSTSAPNAVFSVCTTLQRATVGTATSTITQILAGRLPMAYLVGGDHAAECGQELPASPCPDTESCTLVATVNVPGQNLNNARSVNFAGMYHNGGCVAEPQCPQGMTPQIMVSPVSVSGMNASTSELYSISSFTAFVVGGGPTTNPGKCPDDTAPLPCPTSTDNYWRVCLQIITEKGQVSYNSSTGASAATLLAFTRCSPTDENTTPAVAGTPYNTTIFEY
jgi:prepilin-type N-terminal cleavage/methylation domain-containing protein